MIKTTGFLNPILMIGLALALVVALAFPMFSYAATYAYVNTSGQLSMVSANSSQDALSNTSNLGLHSGVMLVSGTGGVEPVQYSSSGATQYGYVNSSGVVTFVTANTSGGAFSDSINISEYSGVILINSQADENLQGHKTQL